MYVDESDCCVADSTLPRLNVITVLCHHCAELHIIRPSWAIAKFNSTSPGIHVFSLNIYLVDSMIFSLLQPRTVPFTTSRIGLQQKQMPPKSQVSLHLMVHRSNGVAGLPPTHAVNFILVPLHFSFIVLEIGEDPKIPTASRVLDCCPNLDMVLASRTTTRADFVVMKQESGIVLLNGYCFRRPLAAQCSTRASDGTLEIGCNLRLDLRLDSLCPHVGLIQHEEGHRAAAPVSQNDGTFFGVFLVGRDRIVAAGAVAAGAIAAGGEVGGVAVGSVAVADVAVVGNFVLSYGGRRAL